MSVRPHNWTRGGLIFMEVYRGYQILFKTGQTLYTKTTVLVRHCLATAKVQRNVNSVCCGERGEGEGEGEAHLRCPHFWFLVFLWNCVRFLSTGTGTKRRPSTGTLRRHFQISLVDAPFTVHLMWFSSKTQRQCTVHSGQQPKVHENSRLFCIPVCVRSALCCCLLQRTDLSEC